ncbi:hypothetical protein NQ314_006257 [Rhamnusium bicolor]|uniref:Uncharacterized protein n=1 Tax=Rhamnusium bicolor TaxID=1586634 RepID=A0AAV8Z6I1_9CUCU|nr:hypothetical protein NQ314_006257 [Rhamnusium bicolor]
MANRNIAFPVLQHRMVHVPSPIEVQVKRRVNLTLHDTPQITPATRIAPTYFWPPTTNRSHWYLTTLKFVEAENASVGNYG